jgi:predicted enzyme related to lactoylglutathione lyase
MARSLRKTIRAADAKTLITGRTTMTELQGKWIWYELLTSDDAGAKAFYEAVVGWDMTLSADSPMNYGFITNPDGQMTGGLLQLTADMTANGAQAMWLGYLAVDDCDAAVAAIEGKGGKSLLPAFDLEVGRIAMVADPDGVPFYVMTPKTPEGGGGSTAFDPMLPGRCGWNELQSANQQGALDFYTGMFGWTLPEPLDMGDFGKYQFIDHGGEMIGAIMQKAPHAPQTGWQFYFRVADIDEAADLTLTNGGRITHGPMEVPGGNWVFNGVDPQGVAFALVGTKIDAAVVVP